MATGEVVRFVPGEKQGRYISAVFKLGLDATQKEIAEECGVSQHHISKWRQNDAFMRWVNEEIMVTISAKIPINTAYSLEKWVSAVAERAREGSPPTNEEMDRLIKLADRFNISLFVPEEKKDVFVDVQVIQVRSGGDMPMVDEDRMLRKGEID